MELLPKNFKSSVHPLNGKPYLAIEIVKGEYNDNYAYYYMAIPVDHLDIRSNEYTNDGTEYGVKKYHYAPIGCTHITGSRSRELILDDLPFRDGVHIKMDAVKLNLQAFMIMNGKFIKIPRMKKEKLNSRKELTHV